MSYVEFTKEAFATFRSNGRPVLQLNLIRPRERAAYPGGRAALGVEAYAGCGQESQPAFTCLGGKIVWCDRFEQTLIGPADEAWDVCFIADYPSVSAFVDWSTTRLTVLPCSIGKQ